MDDTEDAVVAVVARLCRTVLALAAVVAATGGLVAPFVSGALSEKGDPVALGLLEWSALEYDPVSTGARLWGIVVTSLCWLSLAVAAVAVVRWFRVLPRVTSVVGAVVTAAHLLCAVLSFMVGGQVVDRAGDDWQYQWGWWVPVLAGVLSGLTIWFDDSLRHAGWRDLTLPRH